MKILIPRIILRKLQNSKKNSKNKTILRKRILVNTGPGVKIFLFLICLLILVTCNGQYNKQYSDHNGQYKNSSNSTIHNTLGTIHNTKENREKQLTK